MKENRFELALNRINTLKFNDTVLFNMRIGWKEVFKYALIENTRNFIDFV